MPTNAPDVNLSAWDQKAALVATLEAAAINLRDAELLTAQRKREYMQALDAFNKFVAPTPKAGG